MDAALMPFPTELTTPPVTNMYFVIRGSRFLPACEWCTTREAELVLRGNQRAAGGEPSSPTQGTVGGLRNYVYCKTQYGARWGFVKWGLGIVRIGLCGGAAPGLWLGKEKAPGIEAYSHETRRLATLPRRTTYCSIRTARGKRDPLKPAPNRR